MLHAVSLQTLSSDEQHGTCTLCGLLPAALLPELYTVLNQLHIDSCVLCSVVEHLKGLHGRRRHPIGRTTCSRFYGYTFSTGCRSEPNSHMSAIWIRMFKRRTCSNCSVRCATSGLQVQPIPRTNYSNLASVVNHRQLLCIYAVRTGSQYPGLS